MFILKFFIFHLRLEPELIRILLIKWKLIDKNSNKMLLLCYRKLFKAIKKQNKLNLDDDYKFTIL